MRANSLWVEAERHFVGSALYCRETAGAEIDDRSLLERITHELSPSVSEAEIDSVFTHFSDLLQNEKGLASL